MTNMASIMTFLVDYKLVAFCTYTGVVFWGIVIGTGFVMVMRVIVNGLPKKNQKGDI